MEMSIRDSILQKCYEAAYPTAANNAYNHENAYQTPSHDMYPSASANINNGMYQQVAYAERPAMSAGVNDGMYQQVAYTESPAMSAGVNDGMYQQSAHAVNPAVRADVSEIMQQASSEKLFVTHKANEWLDIADSIPDPVLLWREFFVEGELCCLFADANLGKSILAVQIARDIALAGKKVLYIDFEMSSKQFQLRYMDDDNRSKYFFPDNFCRAEVNANAEHIDDIEGLFMPQLMAMIEAERYDVVMVDNLTWVARTGTEKGDVAGLLMKALINVKRLCGVSMLVLAHTPKRDMTRELTQNDLAGSKMLINFFDAAFAIGRSATEENVVYLKQIKSRSTPIVYGADNVMSCRRLKKDGFLQMEFLRYDHEMTHLSKPKEGATVSKADRIRSMYYEGKKAIDIAAELSVSRAYVSQVLKSN